MDRALPVQTGVYCSDRTASLSTVYTGRCTGKADGRLMHKGSARLTCFRLRAKPEA